MTSAVVRASLGPLFSIALACSSPASPPDRGAGVRDPLVTHNGITENGLSTNGITENGITENGITENGITENGITENGITENGFSVLQILESDPNAVEFLKYVYSCAMPPNTHMELTINGEEVSFTGALGLAPEWGLPGGSCNESCQRWISACLLARTNAYGAHVEISLRAPRSVFLANGDTDSYDRTYYLETQIDADPTKDEPTLFPLREGAYFGNIFHSAVASDGTLVNSPKYYACAGPGSNVPQLTNRFCSSQGDGCLIFTGDKTSTTSNPAPPIFFWETCTETQPACAGVDSSPGHAVYDCRGADNTPYKEVLTIYLKRPLTVCGNHICEGAVPGAIYDGAAQPENETTCPDDCHPGTWARSVDLRQVDCSKAGSCYEVGPRGQIGNLGRRLAMGGNLTRVLDFIPASAGNIDFGTPTGVVPPDNKSLLAAYKPDGTPLLSQRVVINPMLSTIDPARVTSVRAVASDKNGDTVIAASSPLWVGKFDSSGAPLWINDFPNVIDGMASAVVTDGAGDVIVTYDPQTAGTPARTEMTKLSGADGAFVWTRLLEPADPNINLADGKLSVDAAGNINYTDDGNVYRVSAVGNQLFVLGANRFGAKLFFTSVTTDAAGNAFVAGSCESANFGGVAFTGPGGFVVKFTPTGAVDLAFPPYFQTGQVFPVDLHLDADGNVVVAGGFFGDGTAPDFGAQPFNSWGSPDTFIFARNASTGKFVWAKQVTLVAAGGLDGLSLGGPKVFGSGGFDGSMLFDGAQLINSQPGIAGNQNLFMGAFNAPCGTPGCDTVPPVIDPRTIPGLGSMVGHPIVVYATSRLGAAVYYTPPAATNAPGDTNYTGVTVNCLPASGSTFPIGVTTVTCTASDAHGNRTAATFPITVLGTAGPVILNLPGDITIDATDPTGAVVNYRAPTATDQIDGQVAVTCDPPSGTKFPIGTHQVKCTSFDRANPPNSNTASFDVVVNGGALPTITVPNPGPVVPATGATGAIVNYAVSAKDGTGAPIPVTCIPASGTKFAPGATTVKCSAQDAGGRQASASFVVQVQFTWSGFLPPIKNDGTSVFKLKDTVPVKFQLAAGINNAVAHLMIAKVTNGVPGPEQKAIPTNSWNSGNLFRFDKSCNQYIFNMATKSLSKGKWRLRADLHDGVSHTVDITLK